MWNVPFSRGTKDKSSEEMIYYKNYREVFIKYWEIKIIELEKLKKLETVLQRLSNTLESDKDLPQEKVGIKNQRFCAKEKQRIK